MTTKNKKGGPLRRIGAVFANIRELLAEFVVARYQQLYTCTPLTGNTEDYVNFSISCPAVTEKTPISPCTTGIVVQSGCPRSYEPGSGRTTSPILIYYLTNWCKYCYKEYRWDQDARCFTFVGGIWAAK